MNKVYITVSGQAGSGKSTIAELISIALNGYGLDNKVNHLNDEVDRKKFRADLLKKIDALVDKETVIEITERQLSRDLNHNT